MPRCRLRNAKRELGNLRAAGEVGIRRASAEFFTWGFLISIASMAVVLQWMFHFLERLFAILTGSHTTEICNF